MNSAIFEVLDRLTDRKSELLAAGLEEINKASKILARVLREKKGLAQKLDLDFAFEDLESAEEALSDLRELLYHTP
jgi:hypothetical protein